MNPENPVNPKVKNAIDKAQTEAAGAFVKDASTIPCALIGPLEQLVLDPDDPDEEIIGGGVPGDLIRRHVALQSGVDGEDGMVAFLVKRVPSTTLTHGDSYLYEVRDHLGHAIASGTCDRYDFACLCADSVLFQFGYLTTKELPEALCLMSYPIAGTLPYGIVNKLVAAHDGKMLTVGEILRMPYTVISSSLNEAEIMSVNKSLTKATKPKGLVQLLIPDAATTSGQVARTASHRTHGNPYLPVFLQRLNILRKRITLHKGNARQRNAMLKEHDELTTALYQVQGPTVSPDFLARYLPDYPLSKLMKEASMPTDDTHDDFDDFDEEPLGLLDRIMKDPTIALAIDGGLSGTKMVSAVKAQRLFQHIARKIATKFIGEEYIGVLDTPGGDIIISLCMPLAVHAVVTKGPMFGVSVPGARPLAAISDAAFRGQMVRVGLQYAPEFTGIYDMVADELKELRALGSVLLEPEPEAEELADHANGDAIADLNKERERANAR